MQSIPLRGTFLAETLREILNQLESIQRDVFPSGHTLIAILSLYYLYQYERPFAYATTPLVAALIFSTVYCRYHYVVDVFASFFIAPGLLLFTEKLFRKRMMCLSNRSPKIKQ